MNLNSTWYNMAGCNSTLVRVHMLYTNIIYAMEDYLEDDNEKTTC